MNPVPLRERQRFVVQGIVYKVIRIRPNGKATIKPMGIYQGSQADIVKELTPEQKAEEKKLFETIDKIDEHTKGESDAKSNEGRPSGEGKATEQGGAELGQESSRPELAGGSPAATREDL